MLKRLFTGTRGKIILVALALIGMYWFTWLTTEFASPSVFSLRWYIPYRTAFMQETYRWPVHDYVPLSKISKYLQDAVIIAEDDRFFEHNGVDIDAAKKAYKTNQRRGKFSKGASTITMQLARNLFLNPKKTIFRKFREVLITLKLERELPKERILEVYLNVVEWGDNIYGAEAASEHYFKKHASQLTRYEAAFLAAILPRPKFYDKRRGGEYLSRRIAIIESRI